MFMSGNAFQYTCSILPSAAAVFLNLMIVIFMGDNAFQYSILPSAAAVFQFALLCPL